MGYMHIDNLNKNDDILLFKRCWATEKVHGTSAHVAWDVDQQKIVYFNGGAPREEFLRLFDAAFEERFMSFVDITGRDVGHVVFGEAYGGKLQGMSDTYGKKLRFIVFEVKIGDVWLNFQEVQQIAAGQLKLDVVPGHVVDCTEEALTNCRNSPSEVALMCCCAGNTDRYGNHPPLREGIVLRPLIECRTNGGKRIIAKYKNPDFAERHSKKDAEYRLKVSAREQEDAEKQVVDWVTEARLEHVLDALGIRDPKVTDTGRVIAAMVEDIMREGKGEVSGNELFKRIVGGSVAKLYHNHIGIL